MPSPSSIRPALFVLAHDPVARRSTALLADSLGIPRRTYTSTGELLDACGPSWAGCAVIEHRLPEIDGLEVQQRLRAVGCSLPVVLVGTALDVPTAVRGMQQGAVTVLAMPCPAAVLRAAVHAALGIDLRRRQSATRRGDVFHRLDSLAPRERRVMELLASGEPHKTIARRLGISLRTTARLRVSVLAKMGASTTIDLAHRLADLSGAGSMGEPADGHLQQARAWDVGAPASDAGCMVPPVARFP